ncbi:transposase [Verrucomicrobium sp. BvORR034]|uniref:transposase n=1 Tax=Verrucomicrobium sp. BvORR034 TaxID=1396418 RepID=UPI00067967D0|nr:transposase [Verrucomicrobium sp. BvORR034]
MSRFRFYNFDLNPMVTRRRLPHWEQSEVCYFLTFRTADSLPAEVAALFRWKREHWLECKGVKFSDGRPWGEAIQSLSAEDRKAFNREFSTEFHGLLDAGHGRCWLKESSTRKIVEEALQHGDGSRCLLGDYVIMPNHVHVLMQPCSGNVLKEILTSLKKYSARRINHHRQAPGSFWQAESYDRIVRDQREYAHYRSYIAENPAKAGLDDGSYTCYRSARGAEGE